MKIRLAFLILTGLYLAINPMLARADQVFDQYFTFIKWTYEEDRLNNLAAFLQKNPDMIAYIGFYGGEEKPFKDSLLRIKKAKNYLLNTHKISSVKIRIVYLGCMGEDAVTVLQPVSKSAAPPFVDVRQRNDGGVVYCPK